MKKSFLVLVLLSVSLTSFSQVFRIGTGVGGGSLGKSVGVNLNLIEMGYAPTPSIEAGAYYGLTANAKRNFTSARASADSRYGLQGKYYFKETGFKPYAALQAGLLSGVTGQVDAMGNENGVKKSTRFEIAPMVGFRVGPLNMNLAYQQGVKLNVGLLFGFGEFR
ncbi:MAG: hypothetical protein ACI9V1_000605 [Spirosomataceae bacterium]|jgi:hypothetical protein